MNIDEAHTIVAALDRIQRELHAMHQQRAKGIARLNTIQEQIARVMANQARFDAARADHEARLTSLEINWDQHSA